MAVTAGTEITASGTSAVATATDSLGNGFGSVGTGAQGFFLLRADVAGTYDLKIVNGANAGSLNLYLNDRQVGGPIAVGSSATTDLGNLTLKRRPEHDHDRRGERLPLADLAHAHAGCRHEHDGKSTSPPPSTGRGSWRTGRHFGGGGLDGDGFAFSSNLLGTSLTAGGTTFDFGPAGVNNVAAAAGQTHRSAGGLRQRAGSPGDRRLRQPAEPDLYGDLHRRDDRDVHAVDQRLVDAAGLRRRIDGPDDRLSRHVRTNGAIRAVQPVRVHVALDSTKVVRSLTVPNDANVEVLAATLVPAGTTRVNLSSIFNRTGIVADGTNFGGGGLDSDGFAFSSNLLGTSLTSGGTTFDFGPAGSSDVVSAAGQTIALPAGNDRPASSCWRPASTAASRTRPLP